MMCSTKRWSGKEKRRGKRSMFNVQAFLAFYLLPFALCLLFSVYAHSLQSQQMPPPGDVNLDGRVDVQDLTLFIQHLLGTRTLTGNGLITADINDDRQVNIQDLILLIQIIQGLVQLPDASITSISPAEGVQGETIQAVIRGARLGGATAVTFDGGGITAAINPGATNTSIPLTIRIDFGASADRRSFNIVTALGQISSGSITFNVKPPAPVINGIGPSQGARGTTFAAVISGFNLGNASAVTFDGSGVTARVLPELNNTVTNLTIEVTIADEAELGPHTFTVTTPGGTARSGKLALIVTAPPPIVTGISPSRGAQGSTIQAVITGQNLGGTNAVVDFSGSGVTAQVGAEATNTSLPVTIAIASTAATDARTFFVRAPDGVAVSGDILFTVTGSTGQSMRVATSNPVVNEGQSLSIAAEVLDASGNVVPGAQITYSIPPASQTVAEIDPATGLIRGKTRGFATITASSGNLSASVTIPVVRVEDGRDGTGGAGPGELKADLAGRIYQTDLVRHIIRRGNFGEPLTTYAGTGQPGFKDEVRDRAQFNGPLGIGIDNRGGGVLIADSANHVIRVLRPSGVVETVAGTAGRAGSQDGPVSQARFNGPLGVAVDFQGNLFVADSGNSTIRYVDLQSGQARTIAGQTGVAGFADGNGSAARFSNPTGMSIDATGRNVIVADTGNGALRLVTPEGLVTTIGQTSSFSNATSKKDEARIDKPVNKPFTFDNPQAVNTDGEGNIYVVERDRVRVILRRTQELIDLAQSRTFAEAKGVAIRGTEVFVFDAGVKASGGSAIKRATVGAPEILKVTPGEIPLNTETQVVIEGSNFAPETTVLFEGSPVDRLVVESANRLRFVVSAQLFPGLRTLTVQHRGGIDQTAFFVEPPSFDNLPSGSITTIAGGSTFRGDGGLAENAVVTLPSGVAVGPGGDIFIADSVRIRRIEVETGIIKTVAGSGNYGMQGDSDDGRLATTSGLVSSGLAVDRAGNIFIVDSVDNRIRRVDGQTGIITTVAGKGDAGFSGDGGRATEALLSLASSLFSGITVDKTGNVFFSDIGNNRVRRIDARTGVITTVAGNGQAGFSGDGGKATEAALNQPIGVAIDADGNLYIADSENHRIRRVDTSGRITTYAGTGDLLGDTGDGSRADRAVVAHPLGIAFDDSGNLIYGDRSDLNRGEGRVRRIDIKTKIVTTIAGGGNPDDGVGDGLPAIQARILRAAPIAIDGAGNIIIADSARNRVRIIEATTGKIKTIAGTGEEGFGAEGDLATKATLGSFALGIAVDPFGNLALADGANNRIRFITQAAQRKTITTIAGASAEADFSGDGGPAIQAKLFNPGALVYDAAGNLLIADTVNDRIRRIDAVTKIITTIIGTTDTEELGDGGDARRARLRSPNGIAIDGGGNIYIADTHNNRIRRVDATTGIITTIAGSDVRGFAGDGGPAKAALLNLGQFTRPALAIDRSGNLYFTDVENDRVRRIDPGGIITTVIGGGSSSPGIEAIPSGDVRLELLSDGGIAVDGGGNVFVGAFSSNITERIFLVLRLDVQTGNVEVVVGNGFALDGGTAADAALGAVQSLAIDGSGNLFIADAGRIRGVKRLAVPARSTGLGPK